MVDYLSYLLLGSFGVFSAEETQEIKDFLKHRNSKKYADSEIYELVLMYLIENNRFEEAKELIQKAKDTFKDEEAFMLVEIVLETNFDMNHALDICLDMYKSCKNSELLLYASVILFRLGNYKSGYQKLISFLDKEPDPSNGSDLLFDIAYFLSTGNPTDTNENEDKFDLRSNIIKKLINNILEYNPSNIKLMHYASAFYSNSCADEAIVLLNFIIDRDPFFLEAWKHLSELLYDGGKYEEAAEAFLYRIALNDPDKKLNYNCGKCYANLNKWQEALDNFIIQQEKFPDILNDNKKFYCDLVVNQAYCLMRLENFSESIKLYKRVLKIDNNHFEAMVHITQCYHLSQDHENTIKSLQAAIETHSNKENNLEMLYETMGQVFMEISMNSGKRQKKKLLEDALDAYTSALLYINRASKILERGNFSKTNYINAQIHVQKGRIYILLDNYRMALISFQTAHILDDNCPKIDLFLSLCYYAVDFEEDALLHFRLIPTEEIESYINDFPILRKLERLNKLSNR